MSTNQSAFGGTFLRANPMLRAKIKYDELMKEEGAASYGGIFAKTGIFMGMTILGYILYYVFQRLIFDHMTPFLVGPSGKGVTAFQVILIPVLLILRIVFPLITRKKPEKAPLFGSFYCIIQGYFIASTVYLYANISGFGAMAEIAAVAALLLTVLIVLIMAFLYAKGWVHAGKKFNAVMKVAFPAMILFTIASIVLRFIPATAGALAALDANPVLTIIIGLVGIIIATLFLISDFDMIQRTVEGSAPKMYEWIAAFGLAVTVIWLYIKILQLVLKVLGKSKSNN